MPWGGTWKSSIAAFLFLFLLLGVILTYSKNHYFLEVSKVKRFVSRQVIFKMAFKKIAQ